VNVVNRISCFCPIIFFLRGDWGGFGYPGHSLAMPLFDSDEGEDVTLGLDLLLSRSLTG